MGWDVPSPTVVYHPPFSSFGRVVGDVWAEDWGKFSAQMVQYIEKYDKKYAGPFCDFKAICNNDFFTLSVQDIQEGEAPDTRIDVRNEWARLFYFNNRQSDDDESPETCPHRYSGEYGYNPLHKRYFFP